MNSLPPMMMRLGRSLSASSLSALPDLRVEPSPVSSPALSAGSGAVRGLLLAAALSCSTQAMSQEVDPEWPCIQRLVMEVSPAVLWPVPVEESHQRLWRSDDEVRVLAERLGDLNAYTDTERQLVSDFAATTPEAQREERLTMLAIGTLDVANGIRSQYIQGIKRYTRQQIAIADQIEQTLNELSLQEESQAASRDEQQQELLATLHWHERVYDQREQSIRLLCDQPVELEQTLSDVLRDMAQYLP